MKIRIEFTAHLYLRGIKNKTWIEMVFNNYDGVLGTDITAVELTGPSGLITNDLADFFIYEEYNHILYEVGDAVPELGTYNFSVTIGGETVTGTDVQTINRTLPLVDMNVTTPESGASIATDTTFTWTAVTDPGFDIFYGIQIRTAANDFVVNVRYIGDFQYDVNLTPGDYKWQVIVMDGIDWSATNNRTHNYWGTFTVI